MFEVWVPAPAVWINSNQRIHRMQVAKLTGVWRETARMVWLAQKPGSNVLEGGFGCVRVVGHVWKPRRGRYDPGNLYPTAKACVDGFVEASDWLVDDDWQHVQGPDLRHGGVGPAGIRFSFLPPELPETTRQDG